MRSVTAAAQGGDLRVFGLVLPGAQRARTAERAVGEDDAAVGQALLNDVAYWCRRGLGLDGQRRLGRTGLRLGSQAGEQQGQSDE